MFSTLAVCVALAARMGPVPPGPQDSLEHYRRFQLELSRDRRAGVEGMNETIERGVKLLKPRLTPVQAARYERDLEKARIEVDFMRRYERELEAWGERRRRNPGPETDREALARIDKLLKDEEAWSKAWDAVRIAPMPRAKK